MDDKSYRDLKAWKAAMDLVTLVYQTTKQFPKSERYALIQQVQRAVVSVPSNIAEGHGRRRPREFQYHLRVAYGSLCEVETQLTLARNLNYIDTQQLTNLAEQASEVGKIINGLLRYLEIQLAEKT